MKNEARAKPIRAEVNLEMILMCVMVILIYISTTMHVSFSHRQMSSLTDNYYDASDFISVYLEADTALLHIVDTPNMIDISADEEICRSSIAEMRKKLSSMYENRTISSTECDILHRAMESTLDSYEELVSEFFGKWEDEDKSEAAKVYYNSIIKCGGYLQQYCSEMLDEMLTLGQGVPESISRKNATFRTIHIGLCLVSCIVCISVYRLIGKILNPVYDMVDISNEITGGALETRDVEYGSNDEIGTLVAAFNNMKNSTQCLIVTLHEKKEAEALLAEARVHRAKQEEKLQEAMLLQLRSQIMPHFLFNTLNTIARTARAEGAKQTERLIFALSHLFRNSLRSTVNMEVPLSEEIDMARNYCTLQQARFGDRLKAEFKVSRGVCPEEVMVPSFILQPLIENAIAHGLEGRALGGTVRTRINQEGCRLIITVCDNGAGMSRERIEEVLRDDGGKKKFSGIGVSNVRARILMSHPGNEFTIMSRINIGTAVRMVLSVKPAEEEDAR